MDDWLDQLEIALDNVAKTIETDLELLADRTLDTLEQCQQAADRLVDQAIDLGVETLGIASRAELEATADRWGNELLAWLLGLEQGVDQVVRRTEQMVDPIVNEHRVCIGCRHYHGRAYGGEMLICGMHPYGCEGESCPDWASTWDS